MGLFDYRQWGLIEVATSYREFGVPRNLAEEWIQDKYYVSQKEADYACQRAYGYQSYFSYYQKTLSGVKTYT